MRAERRFRSLGALLTIVSGAALAALLSTAAPAAAAGVSTMSSGGGSVMVSTDGVSWSRDLPSGLFDGALLVPGVPQDRTLYVRNDSSTPAVLEIDAANASSSAAGFLDELRLTVISVGGSAGGASGGSAGGTASAVPLTTAATCAPVASDITLAPGAVASVALALELADAEGEHHGSTATVQLHVLLREAGAAPLTACPTTSAIPFVGPALLAATGWAPSTLTALAVVLAGLGIVTGAAMLVASRRRDAGPASSRRASR